MEWHDKTYNKNIFSNFKITNKYKQDENNNQKNQKRKRRY